MMMMRKRRIHRRGPAGFTLMEAAVGLMLISLISIVALTFFLITNRVMVKTRRNAMLSERAKFGLEYIESQVRIAGGNGVHPHHAIFVEDNCQVRGAQGYTDCAGNDRLTILSSLPNLPRCTVSDVPGADLLEFTRSDGSCCFNPVDFARHVMLTKDTLHMPVFLRSQGGGACTFTFEPIVPPQMRSEPPTVSGWDDATAALIDFRTIYYDSNDRRIVLHLELGGNNGGAEPTAAGERSILLDNVHDFQVALGYDLDGDGRAVESFDGTGDEWLYNAPGEANGPPPTFPIEQLVMVRLSLVAGAAADGVGTAFSPMRNATLQVPGHVLRSGTVRIAPRRLDSIAFDDDSDSDSDSDSG